jgi:hypothetical protein
MSAQPFTFADLKWGEAIVQRLHGVKGYDAWAEMLAKERASIMAGIDWQPIHTLPNTDDWVWLANSATRTVEGPRAPGVFDADSFDLWCECVYPPLPAAITAGRSDE